MDGMHDVGRYSQRCRERALANAKRREILDRILAAPGVAWIELRPVVSSGGDLDRHLNVLERGGFVHSRRVDGRRLFWPVPQLHDVLAGRLHVDPRRASGRMQSATERRPDVASA